MPQAYAVPALLAHVHLIAPRMRAADCAEVLAEGERPARCLRLLLRTSDFARTVFIRDEPAAMMGVLLKPNGIAVPWTLTTDAVDRFPKSFWQASKYVMWQLRQRYPLLYQCIDARHDKALRWVKRLGFDVDDEPHQCGPLQMPFYGASCATAKAG